MQDLSFVPPERESSQRPKSRGRSPHVRNAQDSGWNWDGADAYPQRERGGSTRTTRQGRGRRKQKNKNKGPPYAALTMPPPWKPEGTPSKEAASTSSAIATAQAEMVKEIREAYMDVKDMPANIRRVVEKHDPNSGRQLTASMSKTTKDLEKARDNLRKLSEAKTKHRTQWMNHMKSLMETLSKQVDAFETQQKSYDDKLKSTQRDIQVTRRELRRFTAQAAADHSAEVTEPIIEEDEQTEHVVDVEEDALRSQVHDLLAKCLNQADKSKVVEIDSEEENMDTSTERGNKRPRSAEPFGSSVK